MCVETFLMLRVQPGRQYTNGAGLTTCQSAEKAPWPNEQALTISVAISSEGILRYFSCCVCSPGGSVQMVED